MKALLCQVATTKFAATALGATVIACGIGPTASAVGHPVTGHRTVHGNKHHPTPPPQRCPEHNPPSPGSTNSGAGTITVSVPRLVEVRTDAAGHPLAVRTNTGQQPCPGDTFAFEFNQHVSSTGPMNYVLAHTHPGVWTPGQWRELS